MRTDNLSGQTALITGAGSGIGRATAELLARRGADLIICDIDEGRVGRAADELRALGRKVTARRVDVSSAEAMEAFAAEVSADIGSLDILMNNAGVGVAGSLVETPIEDWNWAIGINILGVVNGCRLFVPAMVASGRPGHVINLASAAGYTPVPGLSTYGATKFAVLGLSQALRMELTGTQIGVTAVCPGVINTDIVRASRVHGELATEASRQRTIDSYVKRDYGPERVARNILKAVGRNRAVAPVSPEAWLMYYGMRLFPGLCRRLNVKLQNRVTEAG
ncbi:MAG: SDR family NAD(P)-dependent oxidoreductase [Deltaproteobacteria bacterium]